MDNTVHFPESGTNVIITAVIDHRTLFIRSFAKNNNTEYVKNANDIAEYSLTAKPLTKLPERGDLVLAELEGECYYRALVLNVQQNTVRVAYIDFGNTAEKTLADLKELSDEMGQRKRFTRKLVLKNVPTVMLNEKCLEYLHELVNELKPLKILHKEQTNVTLIDLDRKMSLEDYIFQLNDLQKPTENDKLVMLNVIHITFIFSLIFLKNIFYFFEQQLKRTGITGINIDVVVVDTSCLQLGYIACCMVENLNKIIDKHACLQEYCKSEETVPYLPRFVNFILIRKKIYKKKII